MYTYKGVSYTEEEIKKAAKQSGITVQEYLDRLKEVDPKPEDKKEFSSEDLLDPTTFQADAAAGAGVVSQPMQAPGTELPSEDISSESQDPKPFDFEEIQASLSPPTIDGSPAPRLQQEAFAIELIEKNKKAKAKDYTSELQNIAANIPDEKIVSQEAVDIFGPVEPRNAKAPQISSATTPGVSPTVYLAPKFNSDEEYNNYLKETLGDNYNSYINYVKTGKIDISNSETRLEAQKKLVEREAELFTIANDIPEDIQKYMMFEPEFATGNSKEEQEFAVDFLKENYNKTYENYSSNIDKWKKEAIPLSEEVNKIQSQLKEFKYNEKNEPILETQEDVDQYNILAAKNNSAVEQWEKKGFNVLYNNLLKQEKVLKIEQDKYYEMLDDSRKAIVNQEALTSAISKDYTSTERVGRAWDEFFVQSARNTYDLGLQLGYKALDWITGDQYDEGFDALIDAVSKTNKNYNLQMSKKRENIPSSPTLDEIDTQGIGYWDWFSTSFQDNSPVIATTFIPASASLKGGQLVKSAVGAAAKKTALRQQKNLLLAGKRTAQAMFFTAETGGKFGELQLEDENYSLLQKAFTSFAFGTSATFAETFGSINLVSGGKNLAKKIGSQAARKEYYTKPSRFGLNIVGKTLSGLKSLPKDLATEQIEEVFTQVSHNLFDIAILDKNKSLIDGLNKDFFANVAVTSFGIMTPTTGGNIINAVKNEFITRSEVLNNQKLTTELINLNESTPTAEIRARKKEIIEELALSDAMSLQKLRYMSESDIERVVDLNRQMRQLQNSMNRLGATGERSETAKRKKVEIETEYKKLVTAQQEILNSKQRSLKQREKVLNEKLGAAAQNTEAAYWLGVNDFYNEVAMTQMGDGNYVILGEKDINEQLSKYEGKTIKIKNEDGKDVEVDLSDYILEKVDSNSFYGVRIGKDIIINQPLIDVQIGLAPNSKEAQWAAVAPLEELFHISVAGKKIKFDGDAKKAVDEVQQILDNKLELKEISKEVYDEFNDRIKLYTEDGKVDIEEFIAQLNNSIALNDMSLSDFSEAPSLKTFLNNSIRNVFGDMSWMLNLKTSGDVFNLIKNFQKDVEKQVVQTAPEDEELKESKSEEASQEVQKIYDEQGDAGAFDIIEKFKPITNKIVERRRGAPNFDKQLLTDEIETGKRGILDLIRDYPAYVKKQQEDGKKVAPLAGFINNMLPKRAIEASQRILGEEFTDDATEAKGIAAEEVAVSVKKEPTRKISPKKLKKYTGVVASNLGVSSSEVSNVIDKAIEADLKTKPIKTFGESRNIGENLAKTLGKAFGLNPEVFTKKTRNIQKKELDGLRNLRQFLDNNAAKDFSLLPDAYAGPSTIEGKSTFIPNNILNALYRKNNKGKWEKDPTKTVQDYKDLLGKIDGSVYRAAEAQTIKGLAAMSFRNLIVEKAAETAEPKARVDIKAGAKFSIAQINTINEFIENQSFVKTSKELAAENKRWRFISKTLGVDFISSKEPKDVELMKKWFVEKLAPKIPKSFITQGTFANAGTSAPKRNFFLTSKQAIDDLFNGVDFAADDTDIAEAVSRKTYVTGGASGIISKKFLKEFNSKEFKEAQKRKLKGLKKIFKVFEGMIQEDPNNAKFIIALLSSTSQGMGHFVRTSAPIKFYSKNLQGGIVEEHTMPASLVAKYLFKSAVNGTIDSDFKNIENNYFQGALGKNDDKKLKGKKPDGKPFNYTSMTPEGWKITDNIWARYFNLNVATNDFGIDPNNIVLSDGKTVFEKFGVNSYGGKVSTEMNKAEQGAAESNNKKLPKLYKSKFSKSNPIALSTMSSLDKAISLARNADAPVKKIRVFDFDDTLATTKSNVLYTMPDGKTGSLTATEFAKKAGEMEAEGAEWDFSEFSKVMKGAKGPLLDVAKFINDAKGERDVFVLTARPADAAGPIKEFLDSMGLNIPLENITGLGDGTPEAKARWMVDKAAEGYNDFYFADDASKNVKAVKQALDVLDVKSKVQQAYVKFSKASKLNKDFNDILEGATGIASEKVYGKAKAQVAGASRGKVFRGIAYSAQDFVGLLYETLGKGKIGDAQMAWYKENLLNPYARAMNDLSSARLAMMNDYRALKKQLGIVPKNLRKKVPGEPWTREQAVRVYVWNKQGTEVPGISKNDLKDLTKYVAQDAELQVFADQLIAIQKGDMYPEPGESWVSGSISTDMLRGLNTIKRAKYLEQWQANVDAIFSKENKNKLEAAYGIKYVKALENSLQRMKTGRNRIFSDDSLTGRFTDWLQGSVGAIMFFNTRSAVLQTLSAVNFVNFTDNNPYAAAKAFANQKQYWKDFTTLINSDFLKERRSGLRMNVNEADIADMAKQEGPRGVINKLLQLGFAPTQIADSFAIASGGATFYRNRIKTYIKEGLDQTQAEEKAFQDFRENAEESQQSSRPDKISMQQAGPLGRVILAFANTPAQYARLTDKAIRDLKNNRGDAKTNISKIIYYTTVQNIIFNAVQQALFAMAFGDEEPEDEKKQEKYISIANGMADSLLRGVGIAGAAVSVGKNAVIRIINESKKKRPKYEKVGYELTKISPPVSAKLSRINQAARAYEWNKKEMMTKGFSLDNPAFLAGGNVVSALTNIPLDRVVKKVNNVVKATDSDLELWERVALFSGWQDWELNIKDEEKKPKKRKRKTISRKIIKKVLIK